MNGYLSRCAKLVRHGLVLAGLVSLAGCISSTTPMLTDAKPLLGEHLYVQLYTLRDGTAHDPATAEFRWRDGRYVPVGGTQKDIGPFTLHPFDGADLIVQSARPGHATEYAIARKLADGVYLVFAVDESDADSATRTRYCETNAHLACGVTTPEAVLAMARATAAKPHSAGGLAILMQH